MKKSKRSQSASIQQMVGMKVVKRDRGECIFCRMEYHIEECTHKYEREIKDIMHFIPRSAGGMGVEENLAVGCRFHHSMFDNGNMGRHEEMRDMFKGYLKSKYPEWDEKHLIYNKWSFLEEQKCSYQ